MTILHAVETLSREAGGLPVAVTELAAALEPAAGGDFGGEILSSPRGEAIRIDPAVRVHREASPAAWLAKQAPDAFSLVHQHGIWAQLPVAAGRFASKRNLPLMISPHGMLEAWALAHHGWRKRVAMALYQHRNLRSADVLHATSPAEARRFRELGLAQPIARISLGIDPIPEAPRDPEAVAAPKEKRQLLFLSRIHPKKGLELLLDAWAEIEAEGWELVIAGNDDGGHQPALEARARDRRIESRVRFAGPLYGVDKDTTFRRADAFILPSFSENFGIVVPEAMQYGLPVITTTGTPWEVLEPEKCGWQVEATGEAIRSALESLIALTDEARQAMGQRGRAVVERDHRWEVIAEKYGEVYRWMAGEGSRPDCVEPSDSA